MKRFSLGREERLRSPYEFKRVRREGETNHTDHFKVFILPNNLHKQRLGITTSRKVGSAAKRNRVKRLLREFFRLHKVFLPCSSDILFIAKPGADLLGHAELLEELKFLLRSREALL